ncbi:MAG: tetratricopeptide repeat protein [Nitrospinae bacterium]|nr:tetratricopeptide repeat protein [Nitrospinota bacterium]
MAPAKLGRYEVIGEIGSGGMGLVYKGWDPKLSRLVALKVIRHSVLGTAESDTLQPVKRFYQEARAAGKLSHPAIVTIYDISEETALEDPLIYIAMEYLDGKGLDYHIKHRTPFSFAKRISIIRQIAEGLVYAHERGVIHRDIKPANIILTAEDIPKITDFGLAKMADTSLTLSGAVMGTPSYMSPEQIYGSKVDHRTDIFALSVVLYEFLTGGRPFSGGNITAIIFSVLNKAPELPTFLNPALPPAVNSVIQKGLAKDPEERYSGMGEFIAALDTIKSSFRAGADDATVAISSHAFSQSGASSQETPVDGDATLAEGDKTTDFIPDIPKGTGPGAFGQTLIINPMPASSLTGEETFFQSTQKKKPDASLKSRLSALTLRFPDVTYSMDEPALSDKLHDALQDAGFMVHLAPSLYGMDMARRINSALRRGHLFLLHYKPKQSGFNLVDLLKEIREINPSISFVNMIPIFRSTATAEQQRTLLKFLGDFGIRYAVFLTANTSLENNLEEIVHDLAAFSELAANNFALEETPPAETDLSEVEKIETYNGLLALGEDLMKRGRYEEAVKVFSEAIGLKPDFKTLVNRGDSYFKLKKYIPALADYREANRLRQTEPLPYARAAACYLILAKKADQENEPEKAKKRVESGVKLLLESERLVEKSVTDNKGHPERLPAVPYAPLLSALHESQFIEVSSDESVKKRLFDLAARVIQKTSGIREDDAMTETMVDRAVVLAAMGHQAEAEKIFRNALKHNPPAVSAAFNNYAIGLRKKGEYDRAFEIYMELLKRAIPEREVVLENMKTAGFRHAARLRNLGRYEDAKIVYKNILVQNPPTGKEWVLCELAMTYLETNEQPEACSRLVEAIFINTNLMKSEEFKQYKELEKLYHLMTHKLGLAKP